MSRLLLVELRRLLARRLTRLLGALLLAGLASVAIGNAVSHNRDVAAARAKAAREAAAIHLPPGAVAACEAGAKAQGVPPEKAQCQPTAADFYRDPVFHFGPQARSFAAVAVGFTAAAVVVLSVGAIGAEWAAGTFAALLLWEPRRIRVLGAKLAAITILGVLGTAAALAVMFSAAWLIAATRGAFDTGAWRPAVHALQLGGRGLAMVALLGLVMAGLATVVRSTAGALGIVAGYVVGVENVLRIWKPQWTRWQLGPNLVGLVNGEVPLEPTRPPAGSTAYSGVFLLHANRAALYLGVLAAVVVLAAVTILRRRDVT